MAKRPFSKAEINALIGGYMRKLVSAGVPVTAVYLYGSYAKNKPKIDSDIDICVISPKFQDRIDATMTLMKMRNDKELVLSPIAFSPKTFVDENPLSWEVKQTGVKYDGA